MSETFINEIITNIIAAAIALATGSVEGEGEETAEPRKNHDAGAHDPRIRN